MRNKLIAFVPQWSDALLKRHSLASKELLNIEKLATLFSLEDLASLVALELQSKIFTSISTQADNLSWLGVWRQSAKTDHHKKLIGDIATLALDEQFQKNVLERLFEQQPLEETTKETYTVSLVDNDCVKVVIHSGHSREDHIASSSALFRSIVKQLYVYEEYYSLMSRSVGLAYIESLHSVQ